jgi:(2Fe-2S) ferredoxin
VYQFVDKEGKWYTGMSSNLAKRLADHIRKGNLTVEELNTVFTQKVGPTLRRLVSMVEARLRAIMSAI